MEFAIRKIGVLMLNTMSYLDYIEGYFPTYNMSDMFKEPLEH